MIWFLVKGVIRDRSRSFFPVLVVALGVALTVFMYSWVMGAFNDVIDINARITTGHLKVVTRAYKKEAQQLPNDLALNDAGYWLAELHKRYPQVAWKARIPFGALVDVPDASGETRAQGPVMGMGISLLNGDSTDQYSERTLLSLKKILLKGTLPHKKGQALLTADFADKLGLKPGDIFTILGTTMYGSLAAYNFTLSGTVRFGISLLDRGTLIADIEDVRRALDMENAAGVIIGYFKEGYYPVEQADRIKRDFNNRYSSSDPFAPVMLNLTDEQMLWELLSMARISWTFIIGIFLMAMSIVLWNAGILAGLRRYGEMGIRLALGEEKGHIYRSLLVESLAIGVIGSILGTAIGVGASWYLQRYGIDVSYIMKKTPLIISNVIHARVTPFSFIIGFIPGLLATVLGTALAGLGIYKRQTSQLFKELEV